MKNCYEEKAFLVMIVNVNWYKLRWSSALPWCMNESLVIKQGTRGFKILYKWVSLQKEWYKILIKFCTALIFQSRSRIQICCGGSLANSYAEQVLCSRSRFQLVRAAWWQWKGEDHFSFEKEAIEKGHGVAFFLIVISHLISSDFNKQGTGICSNESSMFSCNHHKIIILLRQLQP